MKAVTDPFVGIWNNLNLPGQTVITANAGFTYTALVGGETFGPLHKDSWNNLRNDELCLCLHGRGGKLFGLRRQSGALQWLLAAAWPGALGDEAFCGQDGEAFDALLDKNLTVKVVFSSYGRVTPGDVVGIEKQPAIGTYTIAKLKEGMWNVYDTLCPNADNGTLNSMGPRDNGTVRNVTFWELAGGPSTIFAMLTIPSKLETELKEIREDQVDEYAPLYGMLPFELLSVIRGNPFPGPGDPLIIWGADDGG